jgi:hypothetical protein
MMAALLGMGLAVPDSAATPATPDPPAVSASSSPTESAPPGGAPTEVNRPPGDPQQQLVGAPFTVESIDRSDRLLIVRSPGGARTTVRVVPSVTEFDAVQTGQPVLLDYYPSSLVSLGTAEHVVAEAEQPATRANAPILAAAGAAQITAKARVTKVDNQAGTLEITTAGGNPHTLGINDPGGRAQVRSLHDGDRLLVTYTEAVAVGLHPQAGE